MMLVAGSGERQRGSRSRSSGDDTIRTAASSMARARGR